MSRRSDGSMSFEDAIKRRSGDIVEFFYVKERRWDKAVVVESCGGSSVWHLLIRPAEPFPDGSKRPSRCYWFYEDRQYQDDIRLPVASEPSCPVQANVFADWLEENGHETAGRALRLAFPLMEGPVPLARTAERSNPIPAPPEPGATS